MSPIFGLLVSPMVLIMHDEHDVDDHDHDVDDHDHDHVDHDNHHY